LVSAQVSGPGEGSVREVALTKLTDGLYRVTAKNLCAGFEVRMGRVVRSAPILVRKLLPLVLKGRTPTNVTVEKVSDANGDSKP